MNWLMLLLYLVACVAQDYILGKNWRGWRVAGMMATQAVIFAAGVMYGHT